MFLVHTKCSECGHIGFVQIVNNQAWCPKCQKNYEVTIETTEEPPARSEGANDKRYRAVNSAGESLLNQKEK